MSLHDHERETNEQFMRAAHAYMRAALEWLYLQRNAPVVSASRATSPPAALTIASPPRAALPRWGFRRQPPAIPDPEGDDPDMRPNEPLLDAAIVAQRRAAMREAEEVEPPPIAVHLARLLGLNAIEFDLLVLCCLIEREPDLAMLCGLAQGDAQRAYPTFALAQKLFEAPDWELLSPARPLRHWQLIEVLQPGGTPLAVSPLRADERIVNYINGVEDYMDDRLANLLTPVLPPEADLLPPSQEAAVDRIKALLSALEQSSQAVIQLVGADADVKLRIAAALCDAAGLELYRLPADQVPQTPAERQNLTRFWNRESLLCPFVLFIDARDIVPSAPDGKAGAVQQLIAELVGIVFLGVREAWQGLGFEGGVVETARPTWDEQQLAWRVFAPDLSEAAATEIASQYSLDIPLIRQIACTVLAHHPKPTTLRDRIWEACRVGMQPRMDLLAQRITPKADPIPLVLPPAQQAIIDQIIDQVKFRGTVYRTMGFANRTDRGLGINALFYGESGTGKTLAAETIAARLNLNLYRIDLSAVVSKYIGETEENLRKLFDAAEEGGAILFFDEADALFGKRSEVKDSHDRYANIEVNYLLQRIEAYSGLSILATNIKSALDSAFLRRLRFIVEFPFPGVVQRRAIWEEAFPPKLKNPLDPSIDLDRLARLNLPGGAIANVVMNAAFRAAAKSEPLTMAHLIEALRAEFTKLNRPFPEAELRGSVPRRVSLRPIGANNVSAPPITSETEQKQVAAGTAGGAS